MRRHTTVLPACLFLLLNAAPLAAGEGWIDLLARVDTRRDALRGSWQREGDGDIVGRAPMLNAAALKLPYRPPAEYDLTISFTPLKGRDGIGVVLVVGESQVGWVMRGWPGAGQLSGLNLVKGKKVPENPTRTDTALADNIRHTTLIKVRRRRLRIWLNDRLVVDHVTDGSDLSMHPAFDSPDKDALGLYAMRSDVVFHRVAVRPVGGTGELLGGE